MGGLQCECTRETLRRVVKGAIYTSNRGGESVFIFYRGRTHTHRWWGYTSWIVGRCTDLLGPGGVADASVSDVLQNAEGQEEEGRGANRHGVVANTQWRACSRVRERISKWRSRKQTTIMSHSQRGNIALKPTLTGPNIPWHEGEPRHVGESRKRESLRAVLVVIAQCSHSDGSERRPMPVQGERGFSMSRIYQRAREIPYADDCRVTGSKWRAYFQKWVDVVLK
ncbi:hypothetical protein PISMIDRAFT_23550 [Pisolithus microcarpus 441]|uniref:Uncharacterized protein n=1 Tax=Pisolithus microcarpus 441 TaxID=765257 RepID=A0A0C9Z203_9AGAM|nr:hypothetical protein BKA83DRAFT_23550 [Pisolithus microcarpus]KIK23041.1 hypothetical protein PISMIDRAFT_23550 [Pisolithus microcarpus 441]